MAESTSKTTITQKAENIEETESTAKKQKLDNSENTENPVKTEKESRMLSMAQLEDFYLHDQERLEAAFRAGTLTRKDFTVKPENTVTTGNTVKAENTVTTGNTVKAESTVTTGNTVKTENKEETEEMEEDDDDDDAHYVYVQTHVSAIFVTTPTLEIARKISRGLVSESLAACINIVPDVMSVYIWEKQVTEDKEYLLMIKTKTALLSQVINYVREHHPYKVVEIISLKVDDGDPMYLGWVLRTVEKGGKSTEEAPVIGPDGFAIPAPKAFVPSQRSSTTPSGEIKLDVPRGITVTVPDDLRISVPEGVKLNIPKRVKRTVPKGATRTVSSGAKNIGKGATRVVTTGVKRTVVTGAKRTIPTTSTKTSSTSTTKTSPTPATKTSPTGTTTASSTGATKATLTKADTTVPNEGKEEK